VKFHIQLGRFKLSFGRGSAAALARSHFGRMPRGRSNRSFPGAAMSRLTNDWQSPSTSADAEIYTSLRTLIYRCRQLERGNDYVRRYFKLVENNVLGAFGIGLQMKIKEPDGRFDKAANDAIEFAWAKWGKRRTASLSQQLSWCRIERLILRSAVRDGGALLRIILVPIEENPFGFTLQPLEVDHLDHDYNVLLPNGNEIRMGIELDPNGRVVQYHLLTRHPGDLYQSRVAGRQRIQVPKGELIHVFLPERLSQNVGNPSLVSAMLRLNMLGGYEEAELIAARTGAAKGGWIQNEKPENYTGDEEDAEGNQVMDMEPGIIRELDPGQTFVEHDPKHPNSAYDGFIKGVLRGLAAGLGVSYTSLANDLEGVNYSSIRAGLLEEREEWKSLQNWLIEELHEQVFDAWLQTALAAGAIRLPNGSSLPAAKLQKFGAPEWKPRRWPWVDPEKDMNANIRAVEKGFSSRRRIIAEQGADIEDIFQEQAEDELLAEQYGLEFPTDTPAPAQAPAEAPPADA
jgi:lambda family phage portal protein